METCPSKENDSIGRSSKGAKTAYVMSGDGRLLDSPDRDRLTVLETVWDGLTEKLREAVAWCSLKETGK